MVLEARSIELLAPARDLAVGKVAIDSGADAVYIGGPAFGARQSALNSITEIAQLVEYAKPYWAKVYVTLNTLLYDSELNDAERLIKKLADVGVAGLIVQDPAILQLHIPRIPLIASTQMFINTLDKAKFWQNYFSRLILPREFSLTQIEQFSAQLDVPIECFVHGAVCVGYSGQCYLSYAQGGRSGNRGDCAQPCRKEYQLLDSNKQLVDEQWRNYLSVKDMCRGADLEALLKAGVSSLKIEGRLKDEFYVKNIVGYYRSQLDQLLPRLGLKPAASGNVSGDFNFDPAKVFNRGFTNHFLNEQRESIGAIDSPKNIGVLVGQVVEQSNKCLTYSGVPLNAGDGITYFSNAVLQGFGVNSVDGNKIYAAKPLNIKPGTALYRNFDAHYMRLLKKHDPKRKVQLYLNVWEEAGRLHFNLRDEDEVSVEELLELELQPAKSQVLAADIIAEVFGQLGNTIFVLNSQQVTLQQNWYLPKSILKDLRRKMVDALLVKRVAQSPALPLPQMSDQNSVYPLTKISARDNVLNKLSENFYRAVGVSSVEGGVELLLEEELPPDLELMRTKYCLWFERGCCRREDNQAEHYYYLLDKNGKTLRLATDCNNCEMIVTGL